MLVFSANTGPLLRVLASGGEAAAVTSLDTSRLEVVHRFPSFLPDGQRFLYVAVSSVGDNSGVYVGSLASAERTRILSAGAKAVFSPPEHILFMRDDTLMTQRFDPESLVLTGDPIPVADPVGANIQNSAAGFTVSESGVLAYRSRDARNRLLAIFDRSGHRLEHLAPWGIPPKPGCLCGLRASRCSGWIDERHLDPRPSARLDVAIHLRSRVRQRTRLVPRRTSGCLRVEPERSSRLVSQERERPGRGRAAAPVRPPEDSRRLVGRWAPSPVPRSRPADQRRSVDPPDVGRQDTPAGAQHAFRRAEGRFSPDGRWIAYVSSEPGTLQVFVQPFPAAGPKWQISTDGGHQPRWRSDGRELFFLSEAREVMAVPITTGTGSLTAGTPQRLFATTAASFAERNSWDTALDGQTFLVNSVPIQRAPITVVVNWLQGLDATAQ